MDLGAKVVSFSDSGGSIYDKEGVTPEKLAWLIDLKTKRRGRISEYAEHFKCDYREGKRPWDIKCDLAFPSATQNEIEIQDAKTLLANGCVGVGEGANMPSTIEAANAFLEAGIAYGPAKAANAGGVAVSGLEMSQNSLRLSWEREEVDSRLQKIMSDIHSQCVQYGQEGKGVNYVKGANIAGFKKVADSMLAFGVV
jgi:glutamate dehydrogenase (NADP+)